jgi:hypothetical protein
LGLLHGRFFRSSCAVRRPTCFAPNPVFPDMEIRISRVTGMFGRGLKFLSGIAKREG